MARPKKGPRERLQISIPKKTAKKLRAFAKRLDRDVSEVVAAACEFVMLRYKGLPPGGLVVDIPQPKRSRADAEYFKANPEG